MICILLITITSFATTLTLCNKNIKKPDSQEFMEQSKFNLMSVLDRRVVISNDACAFSYNNEKHSRSIATSVCVALLIFVCLLFASNVWGQAKVTVESEISKTGSLSLEVRGVDDASVSATPVERTSPNGKQLYCAYDIDITKDGREWQPEPEQPAIVTMDGTNFADGQLLDIYHEGANGLEFVATVASENGKISFPAHSFSVYIVAEAEDYNRLKVNLHQADGTIVTIYVKKLDLDTYQGDGNFNRIVYNPGMGTPADGVQCRGWIAKEAYTDADIPNALTFDEVRDSISNRLSAGVADGTELDFYTMLFKSFSVTYLVDNDAVTLIDQLLFRADSVFTYMPYTVIASYIPIDGTHNFEGWRVDDNVSATHIYGNDGIEHVYENNTDIKISGDVVFKVYVTVGHWLVYHENGKGATYKAADFIRDGEVTTDPQSVPGFEMVRKGYTFGGWYTDSLCTVEPSDPACREFVFGREIDDRVDLYAKWIPLTIAPYTVIFWTQNLSRDGYEVAASYVKEDGTVGNFIPYESVDNGDEDYARHNATFGNGQLSTDVESLQYTKVAGHYRGFCLREDSKNQQVVVTPEGDAVLNLYYDRIEYNFKFYLYRNGTTTQTVYEYTALSSVDNDNNPEKYGFLNGEYVKVYWRNNAFRTSNNNNGTVYNGTVYIRSSVQVPTSDYANNSASGNDLNGLVTWHSNQTEHPGVTDGSGFTVQSETVGGKTYYYFVMQAYYGEDISSKWPTYDEITGANGREPVSFVMMVGTKLKPNPIADGTGTVKGIITVMNENILGATNDANGNYVVVRFPGGTVYNWRYHIWFETIAGVDYTGYATHTYNSRTYYEDAVVVSRSSGNQSSGQNAPKYNGFDFDVKRGENWTNETQWTTSNPTLYHINFVYNRQQFSISYFDGKYVDGNGNIIQNLDANLFDDSRIYGQGVAISPRDTSYTPTCPEPGYVFEGWYIDKGCTAPYRWDKMPVGGIIVYAKWRQIQYRVFLHPNVPSSDLTLDWGSNNQAMNFRIAYGKTISVPKGIRSDYEFAGWFKNPGCTQTFPESERLNNTTVRTYYNKETDFTDPMDKWGVLGDDPYCSDAARFWITRKYDLYARWRAKLQGANGINVEYDVNEFAGGVGPAPTDSRLYLDNVSAIAANACSYRDDTKVFSHWVLQTYNPTTGEFEDIPGSRIYPGATFTVLKDNAYRDIYEWYDPEHPTDTYDGPRDLNEVYPDGPGSPYKEFRATYIVMLRAEYVDVEEPTYTYIEWFRNDGTATVEHIDGESTSAPTLGINVAVEPPVPTREGYNFKGWYRSDESGATIDTCNANALFYDRSTGSFYKEDTYTNTASYVAADNYNPRQYMYAIWEPVLDFTFPAICQGVPVPLPTSNKYYIDVAGTWTASPASSGTVEETVDGPTYTAADGTSVTLTFTTSNCPHTASFNLDFMTPNVPNASQYNYIWKGGTTGNEVDWNTASNWYVYNGNYSVATGLPSIESNIFIGSADCVSSNWPEQMNNDINVGFARNLTIASGATLTVPSGRTLNIAGNLENIGTLDSDDGKVVFCGTADQSISNNIVFGQVEFNNNGGNILPSGSVAVNKEAVFTNGIVVSDVTFNETSVATVTNHSSFVGGTVIKHVGGINENFTFPTGSHDELNHRQPDVLGSISAELPKDKTISVTFYQKSVKNDDSEETNGFVDLPRWWHIGSMCSNNNPQLDHVSNFEYWKVNTDADLTATLTVEAANPNAHFGSPNNFDPEKIYSAMWKGGCWENISSAHGSISADHKTISVVANIPRVSVRATEPSYLTLASTDRGTLLPIELLSFTADCNGKSVELAWTTATEKNNDYFSLERSSDAINFNEIARIAGAGNSIEQLDYTYTDYSANGGETYYRLVQVDYDGTRSVSEIVVAICDDTYGEPDVQVFPNPFHDNVTVHMENFADETASIEVYDMLGRAVLMDTVSAGADSEVTLNFGTLSAGTYIVRVSTPNYVVNKQVVKE